MKRHDTIRKRRWAKKIEDDRRMKKEAGDSFERYFRMFSSPRQRVGVRIG